MMKTKTFKVLSLSLLLTLLVTLCSGCSDALTGYWNVGKEISSLDTVTCEGKITVSIKDDTLSAALAENGAAGDIFENIVINYSAEQSNKDLLAALDLEVVLQGDMLQTTLPCRMYVDASHIYINTSDIMAIIELFAAPEYVAAYRDFFGDAQWVDIMSLSEDELAIYENMLNDDYMETILDEYDLLIKLFADAYGDFDSDILTRNGNTYSLHLDNETTAEFLNGFITYTIENIGDVMAAFKTYIENSAIFDEQMKQELLAELDGTDFTAIEAEMAQLPDEDITELTESITKALTTIPVTFDVQYDLERVRKGLYKEDAKITMEYSLEGQNGEVVITEEATSKAASNVNVALPTEGVAQLDDLIAAAQQDAEPTGIHAVIYLDDDFMYYSKSYDVAFLDNSDYTAAEHRIVDSSTYLPLRQIGEALGEEVGWDNAKKQAFVVVNGENLYMKSFADTTVGRTYIKIRDFEQLGFAVDYTKDEYSGGIVTLSK